MIPFEHVGVRYTGSDAPVLSGVDLHVPEGELVLVVGRTGSGKSTLLRAVNGLVPHFTGGLLSGRVTVAGRDTREHRPRDLADVVGYVGQDPLAGFVTDTVEEELAYGMESLGVPPEVMRRRVEETLDLLGLAAQRDRPLVTLSAGQQQRVAIGSVLTPHPRVLVLDEPTSALDPSAAEEVLAAAAAAGARPRHDGADGRAPARARRAVRRPAGARPRRRPPAGGRRTGRRAGDRAGGAAGGRARPAGRLVAAAAVGARRPPAGRRAGRAARRGARPGARRRRRPATWWPRCAAPIVRYDGRPALRGVDLQLRAGEVVALMGRNGAGKSTLLSALVGLRSPDAGTVRVAGEDPATLPSRELVRRVGMVPQEPGDLLYADTVGQECAEADRDAGVPAGTAYAVFAGLVTGATPDQHPRDLSEGQRLALALAVVLAGRPPVVLLDEPTRGLDYPGKAALVGCCASSRPTGTPWCSPPTTSSSPPRSPTGRSCSPTARSSATGRPATWSSPPPRSPRRSPRCSRRCRG